MSRISKFFNSRAHIIWALIACLALLPQFSQRAAAWTEVLVKGSLSGNDNWTTIATLTQSTDPNTFSGTIDASTWKSGAELSFKLYDSKDDNKEYWWGNSGTANMTSQQSATLPGAKTSGGNMTLKHNTAYSSYNINCSYTDDSWTITITGIKASTGGVLAPQQLTSLASTSMALISEQPVQQPSCTTSLFARTTLNITSPSMREICYIKLTCMEAITQT